MVRKLGLILGGLLLILGIGLAGWWIGRNSKSNQTKSTLLLIKQRPLEKYTIENLAKTQIAAGEIKIEEILEEKEGFTSYLFSFDFDPRLQGKERRKVTGQLNLPIGDGPFPLVVMLRGYVDQETYQTGTGTRRAAEFFAKNDLITLAPDFLGYGGSDTQAENIFEARFQTRTTVLALLASLHSIKVFDGANIFLWGHSNGGQISLALLEITGKGYPTTLWAPISKPFPYSILYYTDEAEDKGEYLRRELAEFEKLYDVNLFSIDNYFDRIVAFLQIHQGNSDEAVPVSWSNTLVKTLRNLKQEVTYFTYPGTDHNLRPSWDTIVGRDLRFFKKHIK